MTTKKIVPLVIIVLAFLTGAYFYPQMPPQVVSHWNAQGVADGYMSKFWGIFLMPMMLVFLYLLLEFLPKIDPKRKNVESFRGKYDDFIIYFFVFMFGIFLLTISWNLGYKISIMKFFAIGFAGLSYTLSKLVGGAKMNWFMGIRTPWTMSNEKVWDDTHALGGKLYKYGAVLSLLGFFSDKYTIFFVIMPLMTISFYLVLFSYLDFKKIESKN